MSVCWSVCVSLSVSLCFFRTFGQYCSCPIARNCSAVYPAVLGNDVLLSWNIGDFWAKLFPYAAYYAAATATSVQHKTERKKWFYENFTSPTLSLRLQKSVSLSIFGYVYQYIRVLAHTGVIWVGGGKIGGVKWIPLIWNTTKLFLILCCLWVAMKYCDTILHLRVTWCHIHSKIIRANEHVN